MVLHIFEGAIVGQSRQERLNLILCAIHANLQSLPVFELPQYSRLRAGCSSGIWRELNARRVATFGSSR